MPVRSTRTFAGLDVAVDQPLRLVSMLQTDGRLPDVMGRRVMSIVQNFL